MWRSTCVLVLSVHLARAVFYHEPSLIELAPDDGKEHSDFGFSLGYQNGKRPNLVIGAPRYDETGRVYQRSIEDILHGQKSCQHIDINFDDLNVTYSRNLSAHQHFYLGASIAATDNFFLTCAPLRTWIFGKSRLGAFGACFNYTSEEKAQKLNSYGLEYTLHQKKKSFKYIYGGSGWSTLVDKKNDKILISKSFGDVEVHLTNISKTDDHFLSLIQTFNQKKISSQFAIFAQAMTVGNYFDAKNSETTYLAVSVKHMNAKGSIMFFNAKYEKTAWNLDDESVGTMFGVALCSADVTHDGADELVVGAPAQVTDTRSYDKGAVHIYTKTETPGQLQMYRKLTILGEKDGARFGTTLSTNDVDGDSYPEILVSAPYENSGRGALYVLCGYELHQTVRKGTRKMFVSDLQRRQWIVAESYRSFGYSVQPVTDFNDNGSDELGIGSPGSSKVILYKGIRAITARVTSRLVENMSESDSRYVFSSCVAVKLPPKPSKITTRLLVKNIINGNNAEFDKNDATYNIDLSTGGVIIASNETEYCKNLTIKSTSFFRVTTNVSLVDDFKVAKDFQSTWVTLSAQSDLGKQVQFTCRCNDTSCTPDYIVTVQRSESNASTYVVGSSTLENVTISVHNRGTMGCNSCLMVRVSGTRVDLIQCHEEKGVYECAMPDPFRGNKTHIIDLVLRMDRLSNIDKGFTIDVEVRKNCDNPGVMQEPVTVDYVFNTDAVLLNGTSMNANITDTQLKDETKENISDDQIYTITNTETVTWKNVWANITALKKPYSQSFNISIQQKVLVCIESNDTEKFYWHCPITLKPNSTTKITVTTTIIKKEIADNTQDWPITVVTQLSLELLPDVIIHKELKSVMMIFKELSFSQNKTLMISIGLILALILLLILGFILYKLDFFKRKNKEELKALKTEFRRRSTRRNTTASSDDGNPNLNPERVSHFDLDNLVIEEETFFNTHPEPNTVQNVTPAD
ncbi:uncharacterized protein [Choristoneura fumiferana]|uniref:uncharacterized protein n=1 Tax=Choristoneura fumiferana TaxID=7141 RepID=UPI003D15ABFF